MDLNGKSIIVTGASSGIGLEFARSLVARGANVFGLARSVERMQSIRTELGERFHPVGCDVREAKSVAEAVETAAEGGGGVDALINNAGLGRFGPADELTLENWELQITTNLRGIFLCTREVLPHMKRQNAERGFGGHIVNIASIAGLIGNANLTAYNASKFGVRGFSEALMKEVRDDGIKVTCVYPGSIDTEFFQHSGGGRSTNAMTPQDIASTVVHVLETGDNYLISEVVMRPLRPKG